MNDDWEKQIWQHNEFLRECDLCTAILVGEDGLPGYTSTTEYITVVGGVTRPGKR